MLRLFHYEVWFVLLTFLSKVNPFILCSDVKLKRHGQSLSQWARAFGRAGIFCWGFRSYSDRQMQFHKPFTQNHVLDMKTVHFQMAQGLSACTTSLRYRSNTTRKRETAVDWVGERRRSTLAIPFTSSWFMICMSKYDLAYVYVMTLLRWYMATFWHIVQTYSKAKTANNQMLSSKILGSLSDLVQINKIYHNDII